MFINVRENVVQTGSKLAIHEASFPFLIFIPFTTHPIQPPIWAIPRLIREKLFKGMI